MEESAKKRVLITDDCHQLLIEGLADLGYMIDFKPDITYQEACAEIGKYEGLIINSKILVNRSFLDAAHRLKWLGRLGSGMEIVDRPYAAEKGVGVFSSPDGNSNAVAEHAMAMLLALSNHLLRADREVRAFEWHREANRGWELKGKTVGIIGFGHTGSGFASKLAGWDMRVLAYDKYKPIGYAAAYSHVEETGLSDLLEMSDIVSFHLPLTTETRHYEEGEIYRRCKKGVILVNTSRGQVLNTEFLLAHLMSGRVGGACLDVFENEKVHTFTATERKMYESLYQLSNVVLSPHIAGWTLESKQKMAEFLLNRIAAYKTGMEDRST